MEEGEREGERGRDIKKRERGRKGKKNRRKEN